MLCFPKLCGGRGNYTVYANPYIVLKSGGYSKHYYIEGQRIVSKLGDGLGDPTNGSKAGNGTVSYGAKQEEAREAIVKNLKFLGQDGSILTAGNSGKIPPGQINDKGKGGGKESEQFQYFYHPDHLGSTSYITDASGEVYQHLEYFAFGETFVEEHSNTNRTPYLFNGKELDEETGLYYYGARYYDPVTSIFPSVDPLAEKFPYISPYAYAFNNPLRYIDPTGMEGEGVTDPPTKEELAIADKQFGAISDAHAIKANKIEGYDNTSSKQDATKMEKKPIQLGLPIEKFYEQEFGFLLMGDDPNANNDPLGTSNVKHTEVLENFRLNYPGNSSNNIYERAKNLAGAWGAISELWDRIWESAPKPQKPYEISGDTLFILNNQGKREGDFIIKSGDGRGRNDGYEVTEADTIPFTATGVFPTK